MSYQLAARPEDDLQKLLDGIPDDGEPLLVRLSPGTFRQRLMIRRNNTALIGAGRERTVLTGSLAARELLPAGVKRGTFRTFTMMTDADQVILRSLTVENTAAPTEEAGQAIALYADGPSLLVEDCALRGFQDTLFCAPLPEKEIEKGGFAGPKEFAPRAPSRQVYRRCEITGSIDFIFGGACALFEDCDLISADGRADRSAPYVGYVCAPCGVPGVETGFTFRGCRFLPQGVPDKSVYLARPWREGARAAFLNCELGPHIHPDGFADWADRGKNGTVRFAEQNSSGPGAQGPRAAFALKE